MAGLLDFFKTPEGQGLLAAGFGAAAGARPGQPWNTLGRGGLAGLAGYANAQDREIQAAERLEYGKDRDQNRAFRQMQMDMQASQLAKQKGEEQWRAGLSGVMEQAKPQTYDMVDTLGDGSGSGKASTMGNPQLINDYLMQQHSPFADQVLSQRLFPKASDYKVVGNSLVRIDQNGATPVFKEPEKVDFNQLMVPDGKGGYVVNQAYFNLQKELRKAGASNTSVTVDAAPKAFWNDFGKQASDTLFKEREAATAASGVLNSVNQIKQAVSGGAYQGTGAELKLGAAKALGALGMPYDQATVANTELFNAQANQFVLNSIKSLGANPSNADREFIEKTVPRLSTDPAALPSLLNYLEGKARTQVRGFNSKMQGVQSKSNGMAIPMDLGVPEPESLPLSTTPGAGWSATKKN